MSNLFDGIDLKELAKRMVERMEREKAENESFFASTQCNSMIEDMKTKGKGELLDNETFAYFSDKVKAKFGWETIPNETINKFINVMSSLDVGKEFITDKGTDEECPFGNFNFLKKGIRVDVMMGQGTAISLIAE